MRFFWVLYGFHITCIGEHPAPPVGRAFQAQSPFIVTAHFDAGESITPAIAAGASVFVALLAN